MQKPIKIFLICAIALVAVICALVNAFVESTLTKTVVLLIGSALTIAICVVLCVDAVNEVNKNKQNDDLTKRQKKWKKTERITYCVNLILLCVNFTQQTIRQNTDFDSMALSVLTVICGIIMVSNLIILFVSWYKLYRLDSLTEEREENISDSDNNV